MAIERGCQHNKSLAGGCLQAELRGQAAGGGVSYYAVLEVERCGERERERDTAIPCTFSRSSHGCNFL